MEKEYLFSKNDVEFFGEVSAAGLFILVVEKYGYNPSRYAFPSYEDAMNALWAGEIEEVIK